MTYRLGMGATKTPPCLSRDRNLQEEQMVRSIDPKRETLRDAQGSTKAVVLFGTRVAEPILASGDKRPHEQAGHMNASDPIKKTTAPPSCKWGPSTYERLLQAASPARIGGDGIENPRIEPFEVAGEDVVQASPGKPCFSTEGCRSVMIGRWTGSFASP
jgi:hypothetical protein